MVVLDVLLGIAVLVAVAWAVLYNGLVTKRNAYRNAFSQIDVQLKRRYDLIPNLVETAKAYLKHERGTLEAVIAARNAAAGAAGRAAASPGDPGAMAGLASAEGALAGSLSRLLDRHRGQRQRQKRADEAYHRSALPGQGRGQGRRAGAQ